MDTGSQKGPRVSPLTSISLDTQTDDTAQKQKAHTTISKLELQFAIYFINIDTLCALMSTKST